MELPSAKHHIGLTILERKITMQCRRVRKIKHLIFFLQCFIDRKNLLGFSLYFPTKRFQDMQKKKNLFFFVKL